MSLLRSQPGHRLTLCYFPVCYQQHFGKSFNVTQHGHTKLKNLFKALPHLVSMINEDNPSIAIMLRPTNYVTAMVPAKAPSTASKETKTAINDAVPKNSVRQSVPPLNDSDFSKELVSLLKSRPKHKIMLSQFHPCYEKHFGKAFNVKKHGHTKLKTLLEAMPNIVSVYGTGCGCSVKLKPNYANATTPVKMPTVSKETPASIKRQKEKLAVLSIEFTVLLKDQPKCSMPIGKFTGEYHRHFGVQIKLDHYGYKKLHDLLGAMPQTVQVVGSGPEAHVKLTKIGKVTNPTKPSHTSAVQKPDDVTAKSPAKVSDEAFQFAAGDTEKRKQGRAIFSKELTELLKSRPNYSIETGSFSHAYRHYFGQDCKVEDYGYKKLKQLIEEMPEIAHFGNKEKSLIKLTKVGNVINETQSQPSLTQKPNITTATTIKSPESKPPENECVDQGQVERAKQFAQECTEIFGREERKQEFARECVELLMEMPDHRIPLNRFQKKYAQHFGWLYRPQIEYPAYEYNDLLKQFEAMPDTVKVIGSENCDRSIELAESRLLSDVELPQNAVPDPVDVMDVEDEEEINETDPKNRDEEDKGDVKGASGKPLGSLAQSIKRMFGFAATKQ